MSNLLNVSESWTLPSDLSSLLKERLSTTQLLQNRRATNKLKDYKPYARQLEFHNAKQREVLLVAANQVGKTMAGAAEVAMHLTGQYPAWWQGRTFDHPVVWIAGSESAELTRDGVQRLLVGPPDQEEHWGTGMIPQASISARTRRMGVSNALDTVTVKHVSGGLSTLYFKSYDQGRTKWQANTVNGIWFDEEPPEDVYYEGITRTNATQGPIMVTFTPLKGMSSVVARFYLEESPDRAKITMTIADALHYSPEQRQQIIDSYPAHEREARTLGIPTLGSGLIFPVLEDNIVIEPIPIPRHWPQIGGIDFGWEHPSAACRLAWDRDNDVVYLVADYRQREQTPVFHAAALKAWGSWIPWAWPHDGNNDTAAGENLAVQYRSARHELPARARHVRRWQQFCRSRTDGNAGPNADRPLESVQHVRHLAGRKAHVPSQGRQGGEGARRLHISASRYACMMLRHATTEVSKIPVYKPPNII